MPPVSKFKHTPLIYKTIKIFQFDTDKPLQSLDFLLSFEKWMLLKT